MKRKFKPVLAILLVISMSALLLTACGNSANTNTPANEAPPAQSGSDTGLVGISMPTRTAERWIIEGEFMQNKLTAAGYEVDLQYANDDVMSQVSQIENMITNGAKFLIICPIDGSALSTPLSQAKAAGIHILAYDRLIEDTPDVDFYIGFNSMTIGNHMGRSLMEGIKADSASADNPLYIELFAGSLDDSETKWYFNGAMEKIQPFLDSGAVIVKSGQTTLEQAATPGWDGLVAQERMQNLLSAHYTSDTIAGALSPYDGLSLGIIGAFKSVGYGSGGKPMPIVTGQDCEVPSLISIMDGEQYSSIFLDLEVLAGRAVEVTIGTLKGTAMKMDRGYDNGKVEVAAFLADAFELTKANFSQYFPDGMPNED